MKRAIQKVIIGMLAVGFFSTQVWAGEMVYVPVNPNFGGNPFNATPLLSNANSQNGFEAPPRDTRNSAADFAERLDRAILSRLSRSITNNIVNDDGSFEVGTFVTGVNTIVVEEVGSELLVTITNNATGEISVIRVPNLN